MLMRECSPMTYERSHDMHSWSQDYSFIFIACGNMAFPSKTELQKYYANNNSYVRFERFTIPVSPQLASAHESIFH